MIRHRISNQMLLLFFTILAGMSVTYSPFYNTILLSRVSTTAPYFTKVGDVQSVEAIPHKKGSNERRQYYITRSSSANKTPTTVKQTIPETMMLLDSKLLWCPNAKAGTTSMYSSIIFPMGIMNLEKRPQRDPRCYRDCPLSAWKLFDARKNQSTRQDVMKAPSFTIVRNPWDRLRSCYNSKVKTQKFIPTDENPEGSVRYATLSEEELNQIKATNPMSFHEFVNHVEKYPNANNHWQPHSTRCLTVPSSDGDGDDQQEVFHYDHIVKIEENGGLFPQIKQLFDMYGLPFPDDPDKLQAKGVITDKSTTSNYNLDDTLMKFYSQAAVATTTNTSNTNILKELVEQVGRIYQDDIRLHDYHFPD